MEMSALLTLDAADRAIGSPLGGPSIHRDQDRKAARIFLSNEANGAYRFRPGPLSDSLDALPWESLVTQSDGVDLGHCSGPQSVLLGRLRPPLAADSLTDSSTSRRRAETPPTNANLPASSLLHCERRANAIFPEYSAAVLDW
jgi:hypothetical protein